MSDLDLRTLTTLVLVKLTSKYVDEALHVWVESYEGPLCPLSTIISLLP